MNRQKALLRLQENLLARRVNLGNTLANQLANLGHFATTEATGDSADAAFDGDSDEMSSQLAELHSRELRQIDQALACLKQGTFGICRACAKKIPLARLNALPNATLCISCVREMENASEWADQSSQGNWSEVVDSDAPVRDQRLSVADLEKGLATTG
jgi:DnaK suppressor protein